MDIALLLTGNELMSGDTVDSNSAMIAQALVVKGFDVAYKVTMGDALDDLVVELQRLSTMYSVVIVNGGLGPTVDDLTAEVLSRLTGLPLVVHPDADAHVRSWCQSRGVALNDANLKQTYLPEKANIVANPVGSAVGIACTYNDTLFIATPGVPSELRAMLQGDIPTMLKKAFPHASARLIKRLRLFGMGESQLQQRINDEISDWPKNVALGFRACMPLLEVKLEIQNSTDLEQRNHCEDLLHSLIGEYVIGEGDTTMADAVVHSLKDLSKKVVVAESCTGGLIASEITCVAGASDVFEAGFVTYSNSMKQTMLGVDGAILEQHGAVSAETVEAMALGALAASSADYVIAVSGIAGPDGGSEEKPVGTVWIAWGTAGELRSKTLYLRGVRKRFQRSATTIALDLLRRAILGLNQEPAYIKGLR